MENMAVYEGWPLKEGNSNITIKSLICKIAAI